MNPANEPLPLKVHEWLAVFVLIFVITALIFITSLNNSTQLQANDSQEHKNGIEMLIKGAVNYPGTYRWPSSISLKEALTVAGVHKDADLRRFNLEKQIQRGRIINVPSKATITIHLRGAVKNPGPFSIPKGSRLEDLISLVAFDEQADMKKLKKRRKLKSNEIVEVPFLITP